jgi:stalled ribosome alternative rescue factor ArfA
VESSSAVREELFKEREESARLKEGKGPFLRKRIILKFI